MIIENKFDGLVMDAEEVVAPSNSYNYALNAVHHTRNTGYFGLTNEESTKLAQSLGVIYGYSYIERWHKTLLFVEGDKIYLLDNTSDGLQFVCSATEFGCSWNFNSCEYLYGEFKAFNACDDLHVYFSSNCIYYKVNISEMIDVERKPAVHSKVQDQGCQYFEVVKIVCGPDVCAIPVEHFGAKMEAGSVSFAVKLLDSDGNDSNWFDISNSVNITSENNIAGEPAKNAVNLVISNLDKRYDRIKIAVIKVSSSVTVIEELQDTISYSDQGVSFLYYGQKGTVIDISTITTKKKAWFRGQDLIQKDGRMFFYNIKNEKNLNYQKYANQITLQLVEYETSMEQNLKYNFPSLLRGETYAFAIVFKFADGSYSHAYHIPFGSASGSNIGFSNNILRRFEIANSVNTFAVGSDVGYSKMSVSDFDTEKQFERKRNPSEIKDRPHESDKQENAVKTDINNIDTDSRNVIEAGHCHDNLYGCEEAHDTLNNDLDDVSNSVESNFELLAGYGKDEPDPDVTTTTSLKDAAKLFTDKALTEREYITRKRPSLNWTDVSSVQPSGTEQAGLLSIADRGDSWVDANGQILTDSPLRVVGIHAFEAGESDVPYPDERDCYNDRFYPSGNVTDHKVSDCSKIPHFVSFQNGVVNKYQPANYEYGNTYVRLLGIRASGIHMPTEEELGKPLCPTSPFKLVYVKRTDINKTVFAKGYLTGVFSGEAYGKQYYYPRYGVNSFESVSRFIAAGEGGLSRMGSKTEDPYYNFHSPDTDLKSSFIPATHLRHELNLKGNGWKHGLVAHGRKPSDQWNGKQRDQRGCRLSNNLNHYDGGSGSLIELLGLTVAPADTVVSPEGNMAVSLMNRYCESSIYLGASAQVSGAEHDKSFIGGVITHFGPTECNAPYVGLVRPLSNQYGSVESRQYTDLNITAKHTYTGSAVIEGVCGDIWIVPYSKKRTGYVSNKVGDFYNVPAKPGSPCRRRSICESPEDKLFEVLGMNFYPTRYPKSGDLYDPKNYAGLHTIAGGCGANGLSREDKDAPENSESDFYWPRTVKSLNHCVVEAEVNAWLRETGEGSQIEGGQVFYPKLKDLYLDSDAPASHPFEESYINRFAQIDEQPSVKQLTTKAFIEIFLKLITPALGLTQFQNLEAIVDTASAMWVFPMLVAIWITSVNVLFTNRRINEMLHIKDCLRDEEGGDLDEGIEGFEDNYNFYNPDYSALNSYQQYFAPPPNFNTCICDDCDKDQTNNQIYHSPKQNLDSEVDAYSTVKVLQYNELPSHVGRIRKLFIQNNGFYAHTTKGICLLRMAEGGLAQDIGSQLTGNGSLILDPILLLEGSYEGFGGTFHPNASINVGGVGYFFVDELAGKIYRFNGQPEEISNYGISGFLKNNLDFCEDRDCFDEKTSSDVHYSLGWDPRYSRLLVTKKDGNLCSSWTVSYAPFADQGRGKWISFHSYVPDGYFWTKQDMYSVINGQVWKHNTKKEYQSFYGKKHSFIIQFSAASEGFIPFELAHGQIIADFEKHSGNNIIKDLDISFNKIGVWNSTQGTGIRNTSLISDNFGQNLSQRDKVISNYDLIKLQKELRTWNFTNIRDLITSCTDQPLLLHSCECNPLPEFNESLIDCTIPQHQKNQGRALFDKFVTYRFIFDNDTNIRLKLYAVRTYGTDRTTA